MSAKPAEKAKRSPRNKNTDHGSVFHVGTTFLVVIACLALYHFVMLPKVLPKQPMSDVHTGAAKGIVVVDSQAVVEAFTEKMQERIAAGDSFTEGQLTSSGADFGAEYMRAIKKYRDGGYLVLDKRQSLGVPKGSEITQVIGDALSLNVVVKPDIFSAPELAN